MLFALRSLVMVLFSVSCQQVLLIQQNHWSLSFWVLFGLNSLQCETWWDVSITWLLVWCVWCTIVFFCWFVLVCLFWLGGFRYYCTCVFLIEPWCRIPSCFALCMMVWWSLFSYSFVWSFAGFACSFDMGLYLFVVFSVICCSSCVSHSCGSMPVCCSRIAGNHGPESE